MAIHFRPKVPVPEAEMRGHVYDFFRQEGYFPLTLRTGRPFKLDRHPIWPKENFGKPICVFHHPQLTKWPAITMECDISRRRLFFVVDHWKVIDWCEARSIYANCGEHIRLAPCMVSDDPMRHANMGC